MNVITIIIHINACKKQQNYLIMQQKLYLKLKLKAQSLNELSWKKSAGSLQRSLITTDADDLLAIGIPRGSSVGISTTGGADEVLGMYTIYMYMCRAH